MTVARVVVDSRLPQLDRIFEFRAPEDIVRGCRVRVPIAGRLAHGYVVETAAAASFSGELHDIERVVSTVPVLQPEVWELARAVADRAAGGAADILRVAIPGRQARVEKQWLASDAAMPVAPVAGDSILPGLVADRGKVVVRSTPGVVQLGGRWVGTWAVEIAALARDALARGEQAIIVVPDHREQWQLEAALHDAVGDRVVTLDAKQSNPDRYANFLRCLRGGPLAIVGPRSAVYAPAAHLGLLVVWEDGDPLHNEPLAPYVTTRDAALVRQQQSGCALVFASQSRSTEAQRLVSLGFCSELTLGAPPRTLPVSLTGQQGRMPPMAFQTAADALKEGPVLVQVARPGHAPSLACANCGSRAMCTSCKGPLARRRAGAIPACSFCGKVHAQWQCPSCEGRDLADRGRGSVRTAAELGRAFHGVPVTIADGEHERLEVDDSPRLVVATRGAEPVAAGGYRAVLLLDGEQLLGRESLRVAEDAVRAWNTARALAAPDATVVLTGAVGSLAAAMTSREPQAFSRPELDDRRSLRFPPAVRAATMTGTAEAVRSTAELLEALEGVDVLGPVELGDGTVRSIVRFPYGRGADVAKTLRGAVLRAATSSRSRTSPGVKLRVHVDDHEPFEGM